MDSRRGRYERIKPEAVIAGDIAIYYKDGDVEHSGIVVEVENGVPWILSKWGPAHEVIHMPVDCEYNFEDVRYYRVCK